MNTHKLVYVNVDLLFQLGDAKYKAAWENLYQHQSNKSKAVMDSVLLLK